MLLLVIVLLLVLGGGGGYYGHSRWGYGGGLGTGLGAVLLVLLVAYLAGVVHQGMVSSYTASGLIHILLVLALVVLVLRLIREMGSGLLTEVRGE